MVLVLFQSGVISQKTMAKELMSSLVKTLERFFIKSYHIYKGTTSEILGGNGLVWKSTIFTANKQLHRFKPKVELI